jgi:hypothetical protein
MISMILALKDEQLYVSSETVIWRKGHMQSVRLVLAPFKSHSYMHSSACYRRTDSTSDLSMSKQHSPHLTTEGIHGVS